MIEHKNLAVVCGDVPGLLNLILKPVFAVFEQLEHLICPAVSAL